MKNDNNCNNRKFKFNTNNYCGNNDSNNIKDKFNSHES